MRRALIAALATLLLLVAVPVAPAAAASTAKVVIIVGPVGSYNAHYKSDAEAIATEARRWTPNVVKLTTPNATWSRVKAAAQGASILVYLGHGNGWPSIYPPFQMVTKDGLGLDPSTGADGVKTVYYGEDYLRSDIRLAPNAVVLLYHLCYASGNTEPGLAVGTFADARERVDNYGAGFIGAGARAVFAEGHPSHPVTSYVRQLFTTNRTMDQVFRSAPTWHGHLQGPYASQRTPGLTYELDPDSAAPSGYYRSLIGDLSLTASKVTGPPPARTDTIPADLVIPGSAEVTAATGIGLFATPQAAADPAGTPTSALADGTRLRLTAEADPAADGTRILAATVMGSSTKGFVRANAITPRDSANVGVWTLDQSAALLSPNSDRTNDGFVVAARFSEPVPATLVIKNAAGGTVRSASLTGDIGRFAWDLRLSSGAVAPDGAYSWTLKGTDPWGNGTVTRTGAFTIDATAPVSTASSEATAGAAGWLVSPATISLSARDATSGIKAINWRLDGGAIKAYAPPLVIGANGTHTVEYRAVDRAGIREAWKSLTLKIDTKGPTIVLPLAGTAGDAPGTWRSDVSIAPSVKDNAAGVGTAKVSVDDAAAVALGAEPVAVQGDGPHTVTVSAKDLAGNSSSATATFTIDTAAPVLELPVPPATPPTVSPNGDTTGEQVALPFTVSEPGSLTATITDAAARVVRTIVLPAVNGAGSLAWDGRTAARAPVPDGRYTVTLLATDAAGNDGAPITAEVDVYGALKALTRTPTLFFPQDADALARNASMSFSLLAPATVSIKVLDASGTAVRTPMKGKALPAGPGSWTWNGKTDTGAWAPPGQYRIVVTATNGTQAASQSVTLIADAFRLTTSTRTAVRGKPITITATTAEALATTPRIVVKQTGLPSWTVVMTRTGKSTWTAKVTPKSGGVAGVLSFTVKARDTAGGANQAVLKLGLQ